jgi:hypothetical protein
MSLPLRLPHAHTLHLRHESGQHRRRHRHWRLLLLLLCLRERGCGMLRENSSE